MYPYTEIMQTAAAMLGFWFAIIGLVESHRDLMARRMSHRNGLLELTAVEHRREEGIVAFAQFALVAMGIDTIKMGPYPLDRAAGIAFVRWVFLVFTLLTLALSVSKSLSRRRIREYDETKRRTSGGRRATDAKGRAND